MLRSLLTCLCLISFSLSLGEGDSFVVATYNVCDFFDGHDKPYTRYPGKAKPEKELRAVAQAIKAVDADVLALEEVECEGFLKLFVGEYLADMGYDYVAVHPTNSVRAINLGLLSRFPIESVTSYRFSEFTVGEKLSKRRFSRDVPRVCLSLPNGKLLNLFQVHFKSRLSAPGDPSSAKRRLGEARALAQKVEDLLTTDPQALVMVLGDFNDYPDSPTVELFTESEVGFFDVHRKLAEENRITYLKAPYRSTIDLMLASPELSARMIEGSAGVLKEESLLGGSDHAPIFARFSLTQ